MELMFGLLTHEEPNIVKDIHHFLITARIPLLISATFHYVHDQTGQKLHYVGHSQGTLVALAAFSKDQQLDKLRSAALLCPIAYVGQMTSPVAKNAADYFIAELLYKLGIFEFSLKG